AAAGNEASGQRHPGWLAHQWTGAVNEHGAVADLVMPVHLEEHRVEPGFRQIIVEAILDQLDEGRLDRRPALCVKEVCALLVSGQPISGVEDPLVIEVDAGGGDFLDLRPLSLLEAHPGAKRQLTEGGAIIIESI